MEYHRYICPSEGTTTSPGQALWSPPEGGTTKWAHRANWLGPRHRAPRSTDWVMLAGYGKGGGGKLAVSEVVVDRKVTVGGLIVANGARLLILGTGEAGSRSIEV